MKINDKNQYHGAALAQIVEADEFTALNNASSKRGHYQINNNRRVLTKRSTATDGPWPFTFTGDDLDVLRNDFENANASFACLVCGTYTICLLSEHDLNELLTFDGRKQTVYVESPPGKSMRVKNGNTELSRKVAHSSFPRDLFE